MIIRSEQNSICYEVIFQGSYITNQHRRATKSDKIFQGKNRYNYKFHCPITMSHLTVLSLPTSCSLVMIE